MAMKFTKNRKKIYDLIHKSEKPLSAEDIHEKLKPDLNLSTVYRGIEYLQSENLIRSVSFGSVVKYFFSTNSHKHFLYCQQCHEIIVFNDCAADQLQKTVKENFNFSINDHVFYFIGICEKCQKKRGDFK